MPADAFLDTNVLIYAIAQNDRRGPVAEVLLANGGVIGVQGLNEFVSVAQRKIKMSWQEIREAVEAILTLCPEPIPIALTTHKSAVEIAERYGYGIYDGLVLAAALESGCRVLYSEDFQDGQVINGKLTIQNPFER